MESMNNETRLKFQEVLDFLSKETIDRIECDDMYRAKSNIELMYLLQLRMNFGTSQG